MRICITSKFLGAPKNLIIEDNDSITWSSFVPDDAWVLDSTKYWQGRDIAIIAKLAAAELTFPDDPSINMMRNLNINVTDVPWSSIIPSWKLQNMLHELTRDVRGVLSSLDCGYYVSHFEPSRRLLSSLVPAHVDINKLRTHVGVDGNQDTLETFTPNTRGVAKQVVYDQFGTRTGRLVVKSGPQILTLKRTHRDVIKSRFKGGKIVSFDYTSLEARIAAIEAGIDPPVDIYDHISHGLLNGISRSATKLAVLATLFGAGTAMFENMVEPGSAEWLLPKIREYFKVVEITNRLKNEHKISGGFIRSRAGRNIPCIAAGNILYNSYVQSTGVDVALSGFSSVVDEMKRLVMLSVPLFVLHDAMIADVHPDEFEYIDMLCEVGSNILGYDQKFPLRVKDIIE